MNIEERMLELLAQSEARMDRTNEMCCKLSESSIALEHVIATLTTEYSTHLRSVESNREELISLFSNQVESMHREVDFLRNEITILHKRNEQLMDVVMKGMTYIKNTNANTQNINIDK